MPRRRFGTVRLRLLMAISQPVLPTVHTLRCPAAPQGVDEPMGDPGSQVPQRSGPGGDFEERPLRGPNLNYKMERGLAVSRSYYCRCLAMRHLPGCNEVSEKTSTALGVSPVKLRPKTLPDRWRHLV